MTSLAYYSFQAAHERPRKWPATARPIGVDLEVDGRSLLALATQRHTPCVLNASDGHSVVATRVTATTPPRIFRTGTLTVDAAFDRIRPPAIETRRIGKPAGVRWGRWAITGTDGRPLGIAVLPLDLQVADLLVLPAQRPLPIDALNAAS